MVAGLHDAPIGETRAYRGPAGSGGPFVRPAEVEKTFIFGHFRRFQQVEKSAGLQDHTTSPSAITTLVSRGFRVHRIPPHVRDDREPPLLSGETRGEVALICPTG